MTEPKRAVAEVASRIFGVRVNKSDVIDESLARATDDEFVRSVTVRALCAALEKPAPAALTDAELRKDQIAAWIEMQVGLQDGKRLTRRLPTTLSNAALTLAAQSGHPAALCEDRIRHYLDVMSRPESARGGRGGQAFLTFKINRFISDAGHVQATLHDDGSRRVTLDGQRFDPTRDEARLYATFFCRNCGQEFHPVTLITDGERRVIHRSIDDTPLDEPEDDGQPGYLMPEPRDAEYTFTGEPEDYPEEWTEVARSGKLRLKSDRRRSAAQQMNVDPDGRIGSTGRSCLFLPGRFRFCPACLDQPVAQAREINKLAGLSAEGRSSATTQLVSSALRWMQGPEAALDCDKRKLLGFTDNRQDAALQAGHFNDFMFVTLLRGAILGAVQRTGPNGLSPDSFGRAVQAQLGFLWEAAGLRRHWMYDPDAYGRAREQVEDTLAQVLAHRVWVDGRRGWRYTTPSPVPFRYVSAYHNELLTI